VRGAFFADAAQPALALDARRGSHPVDVPVPAEDVINQVFDALSYNKASAGAPSRPEWVCVCVAG
jgi:aminopeptidase 2